MLKDKYIFTVRVNGRDISEYLDNDNTTWVEGRKDSEYTLHFRNNSNTKVKVVFSVDGLNVISGDHNWQKGYIVLPWSHVEIPGWRKDGDGVNAFYFSSLGSSYSNRANNGTANVGVLGARVYEEKVPYPQYSYTVKHDWLEAKPDLYRSLLGSSGPISTSNGLGLVGGMHVNSGSRGMNISYNAGNDSMARGLAPSGAMAAVSSATMDFMEQSAPIVQNSLGTGYGDQKEFKTDSVTFSGKSYSCAEFYIYYDDRRGLEQRGIFRKTKVKPQAFPSDGVPPPSF